MKQFSLARSFSYVVSSLTFTLSAFADDGQAQALTKQQKRLEAAVARLLTTFPGSRYSEEQFLSAIQDNVDENGIIDGLINPAQKLYEYFVENGYSEHAEYLDSYLRPTLTSFGDTQAGGFIKVRNVDVDSREGVGWSDKTSPADRADKGGRQASTPVPEPKPVPAPEAPPSNGQASSEFTRKDVKCLADCAVRVGNGIVTGGALGSAGGAPGTTVGIIAGGIIGGLSCDNCGAPTKQMHRVDSLIQN